jgi:ABC-type multidrug transport system fused ATPase/permease subunit
MRATGPVLPSRTSRPITGGKSHGELHRAQSSAVWLGKQQQQGVSDGSGGVAPKSPPLRGIVLSWRRISCTYDTHDGPTCVLKVRAGSVHARVHPGGDACMPLDPMCCGVVPGGSGVPFGPLGSRPSGVGGCWCPMCPRRVTYLRGRSGVLPPRTCPWPGRPQDVSGEARPGELLALIGPSGAGKQAPRPAPGGGVGWPIVGRPAGFVVSKGVLVHTLCLPCCAPAS